MDSVTVARSYAKLNQTTAAIKHGSGVDLLIYLWAKIHSHKMLNCITFPLKSNQMQQLSLVRLLIKNIHTHTHSVE